MKKQLRRVLVLLLAFTMCFGSAVTLFAADAEVTCPGADKVHTKANCEYVAEEVVAPLCGKNGYTIYACTACHTHFVDDVTPALGGCSEFKVVAEVPATCAKAGVKAHKECVVCGAKYIGDKAYTDTELELQMIDHTWGEWEGEVATCEGKSTRVRKCTVCGKEDKENKAAIGHKYVIKEITVAPDKTMAVPGKAIAICENCKAEHEVEVWAEHECVAKDAKGKYLYLTLVKAKAATCTEEGIKADYYECKCGKILNANLVEMTAKEIAKNVIAKHYPYAEEQGAEPTCTDYGFKAIVCTKCGEKISDVEVIKPTGHKFATWSTTVYALGKVALTVWPNSTTFVAHKKGDVVENYIRYGVSDTTENVVVRYCQNEKCSSTTRLTIDLRRAIDFKDENGRFAISYTPDKFRYIEGWAVETKTEATGHTYVKGTTPADCGHGEFTFWYCSNDNCSLRHLPLTESVAVGGREYSTLVNGKGVRLLDEDETHKRTVAKTKDGKDAVNANNHVIKGKDAISKQEKATCTKNGYMIGTCYCEKEVHITVPATGHDFTVGKDATCSVEGYYECKTCHAKDETRKIAKKPFREETEVLIDKRASDVKVEFEGHVNVTEEVVQSADCTKVEITEVTCAACGNSWKYQSKSAVGHDKEDNFGAEGYVYKISADGKQKEARGTDATCTKEGTTNAFFCKVCHEFVPSTTVAKTPHNLGTIPVDPKPATCDDNGVDGKAGAYAYECTECKKPFFKNGTSAVIKATGHDYVKVAGKKATCTEDGVIEHYTCANEGCTKVFTLDKKGNKVEYTGELVKLVIAATGHEAKHWDASENDCTKTAYKYNYCSECKAEWVEGYAAPKGHTMADVKVVNPTCTTDGVSAHKKCKNCDYTEGKTIIPATGHKDADGTFTACNQKGRICTAEKCPDYYDAKTKTYIKVADRKAFKDNHHAPETKVAPATCTAAGYTMTVCTKCNEVLKVENPVAALGHEMVLDKVLVEATEVAEGKALYKCAHANCDHTEEVVLPKLSDLKLNITADNAVVAGATIVESGKVKVTVSISSLDSDIWGTNFTVKYDAKMFSFDRAEVITENFLVNANALTTVVNKATVQTGDVKVLATAKNDEAGNPQNVKLAGTETLVELYFTVVGNAAEDQKFEIVEPSAGDLDGNKEIKASGVATVDVAQIADVDGIAGINVNDLSALLRLMRNEEYSAAADLDKDGEITALDFTLLVNYLSGFATLKDIRNATAE